MAVPTEPTVNSLITEGMNAAGQPTITAGTPSHTAFKNAQFQTLKTEMWAACRHDRLLETESCLIAGIGNSHLTLPSDFDHETNVWVYDASAPYRGTAQTGAAGSITLAAAFSEDVAALYGRYIFTLSGVGSGQFRQITGYDNITKIATVHTNWAVTPNSTTTYLISVIYRELKRLDRFRSETPNTRPTSYSVVGTTFQVFPAADQLYPILLRYIPNLTRLDEESTVFVKHLRERRWLWAQGIKSYTAERYDQDNFPTARALWDKALIRHSSQNVIYTQMTGNR